MKSSTLDMANRTLLTHALRLTCVKCTGYETFRAKSQTDARIEAAKAGWRVRISDRQAICPDCP